MRQWYNHILGFRNNRFKSGRIPGFRGWNLLRLQLRSNRQQVRLFRYQGRKAPSEV
jgi:hypothetical protein